MTASKAHAGRAEVQIEEMIDPRGTRRVLHDWLETVSRLLALPEPSKAQVIQFWP